MAKQPQSLFGLRLRTARERASLPQDQLGVLIGLDEGCSSARISRYETGIHQPPFEVAEKLAEVLCVPTAYFYCADEQLAAVLLDLSEFTQTELSSIQNAIRRIQKKR
ncbi:MAG: helix-turn-helix domain-containing protein [Pseudomonadota bacterium]